MAELAALALLQLVADRDPTFPRTPEMTAAAVALVEALVAALVAGRASS